MRFIYPFVRILELYKFYGALLFNFDDLVSKVYAKPDNIKGKDLSEYAGVLRMHKDLFVLLARDIVLPKK